MLFHRVQGNAVLSGGNWSANTVRITKGLLLQVVFIPSVSTNIYDFSIVDEDGYTVLPTENESTTAIEGNYSQNNLNIPMRGIYTIKINNATSVSDTIKYLLMIQEEYQ